MTATIPCATCPFRRGSTAGAIPQFRIELARKLLVDCCGPDDGFRAIMACHGSTDEHTTPCVGYLASDDGYANLRVRILAMDDAVDLPAVVRDCAGLDLYLRYADALANLEATYQEDPMTSSEAEAAAARAELFKLREWCEVNRYIDAMKLPDGRIAFVNATITGGEIGIGDMGINVEERFTYETLSQALTSWVVWDRRKHRGEPGGWSRHFPSNRRRRFLTARLLWEWVAP